MVCTKFDIPIENLSYEYITSCSKKVELERIVKILRSGEEGHYPDLLRFAEEKLLRVAPESSLLRTQTSVKYKKEINDTLWQQLNDNLGEWEDDIKKADAGLMALQPSSTQAPIRASTSKIQNPVPPDPKKTVQKRKHDDCGNMVPLNINKGVNEKNAIIGKLDGRGKFQPTGIEEDLMTRNDDRILGRSSNLESSCKGSNSVMNTDCVCHHDVTAQPEKSDVIKSEPEITDAIWKELGDSIADWETEIKKSDVGHMAFQPLSTQIPMKMACSKVQNAMSAEDMKSVQKTQRDNHTNINCSGTNKVSGLTDYRKDLFWSKIMENENRCDVEDSMREKNVKQEENLEISLKEKNNIINTHSAFIHATTAQSNSEKELSDASTKKLNDYDKWDKFDVEEALMKMDVDDERERELERIRNMEINSKEKKDAINMHCSHPAIKELPEESQKRLSDAAREKGNEYFKSGELEYALNYYNESYNIYPNCLASNNRAMTYIKLGRYIEAVSDCNYVLEKEPKNVKALLRRATAYRNLSSENDWKRALSDLETVISVEPNNKTAQSDYQQVRKKLKLPDREVKVRLKIDESPREPLSLLYYGPSTSTFRCEPNSVAHRLLVGSLRGIIPCRCNGSVSTQNPLCQPCGERTIQEIMAKSQMRRLQAKKASQKAKHLQKTIPIPSENSGVKSKSTFNHNVNSISPNAASSPTVGVNKTAVVESNMSQNSTTLPQVQRICPSNPVTVKNVESENLDNRKKLCGERISDDLSPSSNIQISSIATNNMDVNEETNKKSILPPNFQKSAHMEMDISQSMELMDINSRNISSPDKHRYCESAVRTVDLSSGEVRIMPGSPNLSIENGIGSETIEGKSSFVPLESDKIDDSKSINTDEAMADCSWAKERDPTNPEALLKRATCSSFKSDWATQWSHPTLAKLDAAAASNDLPKNKCEDQKVEEPISKKDSLNSEEYGMEEKLLESSPDLIPIIAKIEKKQFLAMEAKKRGDSCFEAEDYSTAVAYYTTSLKLYPMATTLKARSDAYFKLNKVSEAVDDRTFVSESVRKMCCRKLSSHKDGWGGALEDLNRLVNGPPEEKLLNEIVAEKLNEKKMKEHCGGCGKKVSNQSNKVDESGEGSSVASNGISNSARNRRKKSKKGRKRERFHRNENSSADDVDSCSCHQNALSAEGDGNESSLPTSYQFSCKWESYKNCDPNYSERAAMLLTIPPFSLNSVLGENLDTDMLSGLVKCVEHISLKDPPKAGEYLGILPTLRRFNIAKLFMEPEDDKRLDTILDRVLKHRKSFSNCKTHGRR